MLFRSLVGDGSRCDVHGTAAHKSGIQGNIRTVAENQIGVHTDFDEHIAGILVAMWKNGAWIGTALIPLKNRPTQPVRRKESSV